MYPATFRHQTRPDTPKCRPCSAVEIKQLEQLVGIPGYARARRRVSLASAWHIFSSIGGMKSS
jgi:hypothetical protein